MFVIAATFGDCLIEISWKLESSNTATSLSDIVSTIGRRALPIFPPIWTRLPSALSISLIRVVVVVFPSEPVTPYILHGQRSKKVSISDVMATPAFLAFVIVSSL